MDNLPAYSKAQSYWDTVAQGCMAPIDTGVKEMYSSHHMQSDFSGLVPLLGMTTCDATLVL